MALIWKKGYLFPTFHIFSHQRKDTHIPFSTYFTCIHTRILLILFVALSILQKLRIYNEWFSLRRLLMLILIRAILAQSINNKMVSKI